MKYLEYLQLYDNFDKYLLFLDSLGFSGEEIASMTGVTRQTVNNAKKRQNSLLEALSSLKSEVKDYGSKDINKIIGAFTEAFGTTKHTKWDRFAARRLADKYTPEEVVAIIKVLAQASGDKFAPSINSVYQLEQKWVTVANFLRRLGTNSEVVEL